MSTTISRTGLDLFAELLCYPQSKERLSTVINDLHTHFSVDYSELVEFKQFVSDSSLSELEMAYTASFDMNPTSHLYIGHHFYGETYKRSEFLLKLMEKMEDAGFEHDGDELHDFLPVILRFLTLMNQKERVEMIDELIVPVLDKIVLGKPLSIELMQDDSKELRRMDKDLRGFDPVKTKNPYIKVLSVLRSYLVDMYLGGTN